MKWWKRWRGRRHRTKHPAHHTSQYPMKDVSLDEIRAAIQQYEDQLSDGLSRTILLRDDNRIDHEPLLPYLQAVPERPFYLSRETFEIFPEEERWIPYYLDMVQQAVDWYIEDHRKWPTVTPESNKINFNLLIQERYLKERPPFELYMTHQENMVTHRRPG